MAQSIAVITLAAAILATAPLAAQTPDKPLGDLLDTLPLPEQQRGAPQAVPDPAPHPEPPLQLPAPEPGRVGTIDLPPSAPNEDAPAPRGPTDAGASPAPVPTPVATIGAETEAAWSAIQDRRRQEINAVEAPEVARLNAEQATRQARARQAAEQAQADYHDSLARRDDAIRDAEAEHAAELARHRERVAREHAEYQARVAACLEADRSVCAPPSTPR